MNKEYLARDSIELKKSKYRYDASKQFQDKNLPKDPDLYDETQLDKIFHNKSPDFKSNKIYNYYKSKSIKSNNSNSITKDSSNNTIHEQSSISNIKRPKSANSKYSSNPSLSNSLIVQDNEKDKLLDKIKKLEQKLNKTNNKLKEVKSLTNQTYNEIKQQVDESISEINSGEIKLKELNSELDIIRKNKYNNKMIKKKKSGNDNQYTKDIIRQNKEIISSQNSNYFQNQNDSKFSTKVTPQIVKKNNFDKNSYDKMNKKVKNNHQINFELSKLNLLKYTSNDNIHFNQQLNLASKSELTNSKQNKINIEQGSNNQPLNQLTYKMFKNNTLNDKDKIIQSNLNNKSRTIQEEKEKNEILKKSINQENQLTNPKVNDSSSKQQNWFACCFSQDQ